MATNLMLKFLMQLKFMYNMVKLYKYVLSSEKILVCILSGFVSFNTVG